MLKPTNAQDGQGINQCKESDDDQEYRLHDSKDGCFIVGHVSKVRVIYTVARVRKTDEESEKNDKLARVDFYID